MAWKTNYNVAKSVITASVVNNNTGWRAQLFISLYQLKITLPNTPPNL